MTSALDLSAKLADLLRREHAAMADFLVALSDFDRRRLWLQLGHSSLFYFLHRELGLSKGAAYYRKTAAELLQRYPEIVEPLRDGRLCISSVVELAKVITPENRAEVLPRFFHCSKGEAKAVAAELRPASAAAHREVVTALRRGDPSPDARIDRARDAGPLGPRSQASSPAVGAATPGPSAAAAVHPDEPVDRGQAAVQPDEPIVRGQASVHPDEPTSSQPLHPCGERRADQPGTEPAVAARAPEPLRASAEPLTADLRRLHVTVSRRFLEKLEAPRAAVSHARPGAGAEEILEAGLDLLLERSARRRGLVAKPRPRPAGEDARAGSRAAPADGEDLHVDRGVGSGVAASGDPGSEYPRHIPAHVRRAVWARDGGCCRWPLASGGICGSRLRLQLDHVVPLARGGPSTVGNLRVLCAVHNAHAARLCFGDALMDRFTTRVSERSAGPRAPR